MKNRRLPSPDLLVMILDYDRDTGLLYWKERQPFMFQDSQGHTAKSRCAAWNSQFAGTLALTTTSELGYRSGVITVFGVKFRILAHRVVWAIAHGEWPHDAIDHINGDPSDNRLENLRDTTRSENRKNAAESVRNTSGHTGVRWHTPSGKWLSYICSGGKREHLGVFVQLDDAIAARKSAKRRLGFHKNHGRKKVPKQFVRETHA